MGLFSVSYHPLDFGLLIVRLAVAAVFLLHGAEKASFWKNRTHSHRSQSFVRIMRVLAVLEPVCSLAVIAGAFTRAAAWGLAMVALGAIYYKVEMLHASFMADDRTGWELDAVLLAACAALVFTGGGAFSMDAMILGS
jgi:putative oxidoreductase